MEGIEFEDNRDFQGLNAQAGKNFFGKPSLSMRLLEKAGVTDKTTANFILLGIAAIGFGITIFMYAGILGGVSVTQTAEQIVAQQQVMLKMQNLK